MSGGLDDEEGTEQSKYVKLISSDKCEFIVERDAALASGMINRLINSGSNWKETKSLMPEIDLKSIRSDILEIVIKYFYHKKKYDNSSHDLPIPDFGKMNIPHQKVVHVLMAAHYLDC